MNQSQFRQKIITLFLIRNNRYFKNFVNFKTYQHVDNFIPKILIEDLEALWTVINRHLSEMDLKNDLGKTKLETIEVSKAESNIKYIVVKLL